MIGLWADYNVDFGRSAADFTAFGLRDAASHGDNGASPILAAQAANFRIDLFRRLFADMAGIENDEVGIRLLVSLRHTLTFKHFGHAFAIIDVHLAAIVFDRIGFWGIRAHDASLYIARRVAATIHCSADTRPYFSGNRLAVGVVGWIKWLKKMQYGRYRS